ncbi:hypothetical protein GGTG_04276 [Gaeumannomyces tritici R3-111a-1]|uniref:Uncharacterized protein n=1 Tax=Gaeumannomyces tritici (strain R3-111a-1) TaxID=644352 RepID=J3NSM5_GAET3|nr:hypothetical protein GGTG_04276 [Gaeumannomyces tritici R3-111a-1]EJT79188.1 hypothetical protein GGTG_04276 [Gaeumannomyces tritici R3-111a-1]
MTMNEQRLRQLSELKKGAQDRIRRLEEQKERFETMESLVASVPPSDQTALSQSARKSAISRDERREPESITDSVRENRKTIEVLGRAIAKSKKEIAEWEEEARRMQREEAWGKEEEKKAEDAPRRPSPERK